MTASNTLTIPTALRAEHSCKMQCAPSPTGCLRCESVPSTSNALPTLLFGPLDADTSTSLHQTLTNAGLDFTAVGPVLLLTHAQLPALQSLLKSQLSPLTQSRIAAAYVRSGIVTMDQIMSTLLVARPLSELLDTLEHEWIREALSDDWLFSVFHPIIHAKTGDLFAQEALLRARNPHTQQVLGAGTIINACEKLNLHHQMDQRARQIAIRGAAQHVPDTSRIFINFLPNTIYDPAICLRTTMEAAAEYHVAMSRIVFEVVETEKIPDMDHLRHILEYYRERGAFTAIDDMGAGHTGVDYITELHPNFVKLDREFVLAAEQTDQGRKQMDLIISTSHTHAAQVIAEGIETEAQMNLCINAGVDFLQGFLFAKPACPPQPVTYPASRQLVA